MAEVLKTAIREGDILPTGETWLFGLSPAVVCLSVTGAGELVQAGFTDHDETFCRDIWHSQEHISLKLA